MENSKESEASEFDLEYAQSVWEDTDDFKDAESSVVPSISEIDKLAGEHKNLSFFFSMGRLHIERGF